MKKSKLSPDAQAVMDSIMGVGLRHYPLIAAAVLRTVADRIVPEPDDVDKENLSLAAIRNRCKVRDQIIAIAAELKGTADG